MFRINCTSTRFYVINTIVCYLNEIGWSNWFDSYIHCYAPFCFWRIFPGVRLRPWDLLHRTPAWGSLTTEHMYLYVKQMFDTYTRYYIQYFMLSSYNILIYAKFILALSDILLNCLKIKYIRFIILCSSAW